MIGQNILQYPSDDNFMRWLRAIDTKESKINYNNFLWSLIFRSLLGLNFRISQEENKRWKSVLQLRHQKAESTNFTQTNAKER